MIREYDISTVIHIYQGSDGEATKHLYERLERLGVIGLVAIQLFRASKLSDRAQGCRPISGVQWRALDLKRDAIDDLTEVLTDYAAAPWGWGRDDKRAMGSWILFIDTPEGQITLYTRTRGKGPDYPSQWDGMRGQGPDRVCRWVARLLRGDEGAVAA